MLDFTHSIEYIDVYWVCHPFHWLSKWTSCEPWWGWEVNSPIDLWNPTAQVPVANSPKLQMYESYYVSNHSLPLWLATVHRKHTSTKALVQDRMTFTHDFGIFQYCSWSAHETGLRGSNVFHSNWRIIIVHAEYDMLNHNLIYDSMTIIDHQFCYLKRDVSPRAQAAQHHMLSHNLGGAWLPG